LLFAGRAQISVSADIARFRVERIEGGHGAADAGGHGL